MSDSQISLSPKAWKDVKKVPQYISIKLMAWIEDVKVRGLHEVRKVPGFHDEPLKGKHKGKRSIRLSKSYRALYTVDKENKVYLITILEVNHHEY